MKEMSEFIPETLDLWKRPSHYFGAEWEGWYVFLTRNRDSSILKTMNFDIAFERLQKVYNKELSIDDMPSVQIISESHWAVGYVEWIAIHSSDIEALKEADKINSKLESYPCLNDDKLSELEDKEAQRVWKENYNIEERLEYIRENRSQFEFRDYSDMISMFAAIHFVDMLLN
mgnify:FL=1